MGFNRRECEGCRNYIEREVAPLMSLVEENGGTPLGKRRVRARGLQDESDAWGHAAYNMSAHRAANGPTVHPNHPLCSLLQIERKLLALGAQMF